MENERASYPFIAIAFIALAGGVACVVWADELGGYRFPGASVAVLIAMLCLARMSALRRAQARARPAPKPKAAKAMPPTPAQLRDDAEEAVIEARLAALRQGAQEPGAVAAKGAAAGALADMVVTEGSHSQPMPLPGSGDDDEPVTMQEMEALRAQIELLQQQSRTNR